MTQTTCKKVEANNKYIIWGVIMIQVEVYKLINGSKEPKDEKTKSWYWT